MLGTNARPTEYQVEAAYLFNFGKFVDWPPNHADAQSGPLVICVLGDDPFGSSLDSMLRQGTVKGRQLAARRIGRIEDAVGCQMLYISASESERVDRILSGVGGNSVLTVSDLPKFTDRGGMIQFLREDGRVRFQINLGAAENAGLVVSSELLKVAVTVKRK